MSAPETNGESRRRAVPPISAPLTANAVEQTQVSRYHTKGGHGFAAEDANNLADRLRGRDAEVVGGSNKLNGADRAVGGIQIQSKYFQSASETVASAFDSSTGAYRYPGQLLEVPNDQYEACVELMRRRIAQGQVPGASNPAEAEAIVMKGSVSYRQARNIAKAGNVDSIVFDATTQAVTSTCTFAISFGISYAQSAWRGEDPNKAVRDALEMGFVAGSTTLITGVLSAQLLRTKVAALGVVSIRSGVKAVSGTPLGLKAVHQIAAGSLGKAVTGAAAASHVSKLLRSNAVTASVATVVTSTPDFYRAAFERSISWTQFTKNTSINVAGVVSGTAGWISGAAAGAAVGTAVPLIGTAAGAVAGGLIGALGGGIGGASLAKVAADRMVEDDAKAIFRAISDEMLLLASEYLLNEAEFERVGAEARKTLDAKRLRGLFKRSKKGVDRAALTLEIRREFEPLFERISRERPRIIMPDPETVNAEVVLLVEAMVSADDTPVA
jgi:hypothetical protein